MDDVESEGAALIAGGGRDEQSPQELIDEIHAVAEVEAGTSGEYVYGRAGRRFDRKSPLFIGAAGALGVACVVALCAIILAVGQILLLIALAIVIAIGLDPPVAWLHRQGMPRWLAVTAVLTVVVGAFIGFLA